MIPITPVTPEINELRFLVVEDHSFQRWALDNLLGRLGARHIYTAPDGQAALELIDGVEEPVDIVVSDLDMPGMDGMEFLRHLGKRRLPASVILASGLEVALIASVESMGKEYGVDMLAAMKKPITPKDLLEAIGRYRRGNAAAGPPPEPHRFGAEEIRAAFASDELEPYYQPKVRLADGVVVGAEALARWRHPSRGLLTAQAFMTSVTGELDLRLTLLMVRRAAQACVAWQALGFPGTVSVNLSPDALRNPAVADRLAECVKGQGLTPQQMVFEVTESGSATPQAFENLSRLRMKGFGLSIDDYGIGYSSMERLTRIAFTELKIDRAFVKGAATLEASRAMLESSLEMAHKLRIPAVAEGVENQAEWNLLRELGCGAAQGFFIGRPMDRVSYKDWLRGRR